MSAAQPPVGGPLANPRIRTVIGFSSGLIIVLVAVLFVDDLLVQWLLVSVGAVDALVTPYVLEMVIEQQHGTGEFQ